MKKIWKLILLLLVTLSVFAKEEPKYPVSDIPEEMKAGMYAVIRESKLEFEINAINNSRSYYRVVITILNSKANEYAYESVAYDKFSSIKFFRGTLYDASGNVVKHLKQNEILDESAYDGYSLFSDNRIKSANLTFANYPYTVEFEYEIEEKGLYSIPDFYMYRDDEISVQKAEYNLVYPVALKPRYKLFKIQEPIVGRKDNKEILTWSFENIIPAKFEKMDPSLNQVVPNITAAPGKFEYDGYAGDMSTWTSYGKWKASLLNDRDHLPENTKKTIRELTEGLPDVESKTKVLYEYLQRKTRYVSISLGIGGLQPFDAEVVDRTGYGDCKALSNYMIAMLKVAGIKGFYSSIMAGENARDVDVDFPSHQSNHIIVSVPNGKDTLWLECTSQTNPFGYLGTFTGNRKALALTEDGAQLINTVRYPTDGNKISRMAEVYLDNDGNAKSKVATTYSALEYEYNNLNFVLDGQYDSQKKWILENTEIPSFDLLSFNLVNNKSKIPSALINLDLNLNRLASVNGKRLFLTPNLMNRCTFIPEKLVERKTDIFVRWGSVSFDTIRYHIPENIYPEFLPEPVKISSRFGDYEATFQVDQGSIVYTRKFKVRNGRFPASSYKEFSDFYRSVNKADNLKIVFLNKT